MTVDLSLNLGNILTLLGAAAGFVWGYSQLNARMKHVESWVEKNDNTAVRLAEMETTIRSIGESLQRIEASLDMLRSRT